MSFHANCLHNLLEVSKPNKENNSLGRLLKIFRRVQSVNIFKIFFPALTVIVVFSVPFS